MAYSLMDNALSSGHVLLGLAEGVQFVDVLVLVDGVIGEDQSLADCPEGVLDPIEIPAAVSMAPGSSDHIRLQLIGELFDGIGDAARSAKKVGCIHGFSAAKAALNSARFP